MDQQNLVMSGTESLKSFGKHKHLQQRWCLQKILEYINFININILLYFKTETIPLSDVFALARVLTSFDNYLWIERRQVWEWFIGSSSLNTVVSCLNHATQSFVFY